MEDGISTHYIVLAFELRLADSLKVMETAQHNEYKWFAIEDTDASESSDPDVHKNVLEYFKVPSMMNENQYQILNARRDLFSNLVWQTPVLSLTAQAFIFKGGKKARCDPFYFLRRMLPIDKPNSTLQRSYELDN